MNNRQLLEMTKNRLDEMREEEYQKEKERQKNERETINR